MTTSLIHLQLALIICAGVLFISVLIDVDHLPWIILHKKWNVLKNTYNPDTLPVVGKSNFFEFNPIIFLHNVYFYAFCCALLVLFYFTNKPIWVLFMLGIVLGLSVHLIADNRFPWFTDWFHRGFNFNGNTWFKGVVSSILIKIFG